MQLRKLKPDRASLPYLLIGIITGVLQALTWPRNEIFFLNFLFYIPFLLTLNRADTFKKVFWLGFSHSVVETLVGFYWLGYMAQTFGGMPYYVAPIVTLLYALVGESQHLLFAIFVYGFQKIRGQKIIPIGLAFIYVAIDWLYPKIFPDTQGAMLLKWKQGIQIADIFGVYGLTFVVIFCNALLARWFEVFYRKCKGSRCSWGPLLIQSVLAIAMLFAMQNYGNYRIKQFQDLDQEFTNEIKFSLIQANIGDADKLASEKGGAAATQYILDTYKNMSLQAIKEFKPDLVVWPETSYPFLYTHLTNSTYNQKGEARDLWILNLVKEMGVPLYFGGYSSTDKVEYNSTWLVQSREQPAQLYRKHILLAFGETVPLGPFSKILYDLFPAIGNFGQGPGPSLMNLKGVGLGSLICYETLSQSYVKETVKKGADILINVTNDSWFGPTSEPFSHLALSTFRAIETRRPLVRGTNTGISVVIDRLGQWIQPTELFQPVIHNTTVKVPRSSEEEKVLDTIFIKYGPWFECLCIAVLLGHFFAIVRTLLKRRKSKLEKFA